MCAAERQNSDMMVILLLFFICGALCTPDENIGVQDENLFEGDMILTPAQRQAALAGHDVSKAGIGRGSIFRNLWPGAVMPYTIDRRMSQNVRAMQIIRAGMKLWTDTTCVRFKPRTNERAYAHFYIGGGCSSMVGRTGAMQRISLATGCWYAGIVAHEIGHALGFFHEQSRPDRDQYVTIYWNNIIGGMAYNFNKYPTSQINSLGTPYDYNSVMHYGSNAFSSNGRQTIVAKNGASLGNRRGPSRTDINQMNLLYKCDGGGGGGSGGGESTPAPPTPAPTNPPPTCRDMNGNCASWAWAGYCRVGNYYHQYMSKNCKKSCNMCGNCIDRNIHCSSWAQRGECQRNPRYMLVYCKRSCRVC